MGTFIITDRLHINSSLLDLYKFNFIRLIVLVGLQIGMFSFCVLVILVHIETEFSKCFDIFYYVSSYRRFESQWRSSFKFSVLCAWNWDPQAQSDIGGGTQTRTEVCSNLPECYFHHSLGFPFIVYVLRHKVFFYVQYVESKNSANFNIHLFGTE